jgi:hypothetical protein
MAPRVLKMYNPRQLNKTNIRDILREVETLSELKETEESEYFVTLFHAYQIAKSN